MDSTYSNNSLYSERGQVPICFACNLPSTPLPLTEAHMARSSLKNVEKESMKWPALVFTDSDSLAKTVKKDVGQSHDKRFRIVVSMSEKDSEQWRILHCCSGCRHICKSQTL